MRRLTMQAVFLDMGFLELSLNLATTIAVVVTLTLQKRARRSDGILGMILGFLLVILWICLYLYILHGVSTRIGEVVIGIFCAIICIPFGYKAFKEGAS